MSTLNRPEWAEYVGTLMHSTEPIGHEIGIRVWELSTDAEILAYLATVMASNPMGTQPFDVAWEIWALLTGRLRS